MYNGILVQVLLFPVLERLWSAPERLIADISSIFWDEYAEYVRSYACLGVPQQDWTPLKARFFDRVFQVISAR